MELGTPEERVGRARDSFERNGLHAMVDPRGDGFLHLESGHHVLTTLHVDRPEWTLHVSHDSDPLLERKITHDLGPGDEDVGDRIASYLRRPETLRAMREQMNGGAEGSDGRF